MFLNSNHTRIKITVVLLSLVASILLVIGARSRFVSALRNEAKPQEPSSARRGERVEAELLTVRPNGFDPVELRRPSGRFNLRVNNRSGIPELQLRLSRARGERLQELQLARGKLTWNAFLELPLGSYILTEANHPNWICTITITAR